MNVFATSPAHAPAREARSRIEAIAGALRESPTRFDRKGVADRLTRAIRALYAVIDTSIEAPAHHDGLVECARVLDEARQILAGAMTPRDADPKLRLAVMDLDATSARIRRATDEIVDWMLARRGDMRAGFARPPVAPRPFRASVAEPQLHSLARGPIASSIDIAPVVTMSSRKPRRPAPPKPRTLEELRSAGAAKPEPEPELEPEPESVATSKPIGAPSDGEVLRRVAHDCLEDIASFRLLRQPIPSETWLDQAPFEQRLLDNVDAFVALGEAALASVTLFHAEAPAPDPSRAFAVALTLGCIEGTDTVDVAIATMKQSPPEELSGFVEGFVLASSPAIDVEMVALLDEANPALASAAIDILGARGTLPPEAVDRLLERREPTISAKLAAALGRSVVKTKAIAALGRLLDEDPSDELYATICSSLLRRGDGEVRQRLRDAIRARSSRAALATRLLASSGRGDDLSLLLEGLSLSVGEDTVLAFGRYGSVGAVGALFELLENDDEAVGSAAAEALDFMTNAGLRQTVQVPWAPGVTPPDGSKPAARAVSMPVRERLAWEKWFAGARTRLDPRVKIRGGLPFVPSMIVDELERALPTARRGDALFELVVTTGVGMRFDPCTWVARQKRQLAELRAQVRSLGSESGAWWFAGAGLTSR